jgi:hypothetical protein
MESNFVPYQQALALKELGFDEPCLAFYSTKKELYPVFQEPSKGPYFNNGNFIETLRVPLYQQAFRWFREKHKLYPEIGLHDREDEKTWRFTISILGCYELAYNQNVGKEPYHKTYEEAEQACLEKLIEIVNENLILKNNES